MLVGVNESTVKTLHALNDSPYEFILTGSRFFTPEKAGDADWDFFCLYSKEVVEFLKDLNFFPHKNYWRPVDFCSDVVWVYRHYPSFVDIILTTHPDERRSVQTTMRAFNFKSRDAKAWEELFSLVLEKDTRNGEIEP